MSATTRPGVLKQAPALDALLHPVPLSALVLLLVNDHVLKASHPGWWTGKLSDVAVMVLLPLLLLAGWDLLRLAGMRLPSSDRRLAIASVIAAAGLFATIEVVPLGADLYSLGLGSAQWPFRAIEAIAAAEPIPPIAGVHVTSDPTDLLALPAALVVLAIRPWGGVSRKP